MVRKILNRNEVDIYDPVTLTFKPLNPKSNRSLLLKQINHLMKFEVSVIKIFSGNDFYLFGLSDL